MAHANAPPGDGRAYVAGPNQSLEDPLGIGGEQLHEWAFATRAWNEAHVIDAGEENPDDPIVDETIARPGVTIMGRGIRERLVGRTTRRSTTPCSSSPATRVSRSRWREGRRSRS